MTLSLLNGLHVSLRGLQSTEEHIKIASQNITNADRPGYTRKTFESDYITGNFGSVPIGGTIFGSLNKFLLEGVVSDTINVGKKAVVSEFLDIYVRRTGSIPSDFSLTSTLNDFFSHLDLLTIGPENRVQKEQTVSDAEVIALYLRDMSNTIQSQRTEVEIDIDKTVDRINQALTNLNDINEKIIRTAPSNSAALADFEDKQGAELQKLAEEIDFTYYFDSRDRVQIYHPGGQPMLLLRDLPLSFDPVSTLVGSVTYPSGINPIELNGVDITTSIKGGRLGGLIELRDVSLVEEQEKFNEFASVLRDTLNAALNTRASRPSRNELVGEMGFAAADPFAGTGNVRVAITNNAGVVQSFTDLNLAAYGTVGAVATALNGLPGITASLSVDGELIVTSIDPTLGVSINEMSSDVGANNRGFSHFFGLNNLFTGLGAEDIRVADYLLANSDHLALGELSASATLAVGDIGISLGDSSVSASLSTALDRSISFNAAGDFSAQNVSLRTYAESVMSRAALKGSIAQDEFDAADVVRQQEVDFMNNTTGVNVDEEMGVLLEMESHYQASAQVIAVIKGLLEELIATVR